ncbi:MAG: C2H2-type zinc finger protein [Actinobacteria bacterium]|nr:C2H2-type zinc finger protein [Actinomycetota bacterium]
MFCNNLTDDMNGNLKHMEKKHGFFVPQSDYCKDVKGLLLYLHEKTEVGLLCLYCENKGAKDFTNG